jgi:hypothetical protein
MIFRMMILLALVSFSGQGLAQTGEGENRFSLDQPGILIITAASDTSAGFHWRPGPGTGRISLVWEGGVLSVPDTLAMDGFPNDNLGIPLRAGFSGAGQDGPLLLDDGIYSVNESLMMGDGVIQLMVSDGELEIFGPRFSYTRPQPTTVSDKTKANFLLIAGLLVLIAVLLRRARRILRKGA